MASLEQPKQEESLLIRAVKASMDDQGRVVGATLHQTMGRIDPSFSFKALRYRTFTEFLEASPEVQVSRPRGRGDVTVELASDHGRERIRTNGAQIPNQWDTALDVVWSQRAKQAGAALPGPWAAGEAARVLGVPKLSASQYRTLQRLLDASDYLKSRWLRDGNTIRRR